MELKKFQFYPNELSDKLDNGIIISFSFSTLDKKLAKIIEPGAPSPMARLETMKKFNDAGFKTGIINMPALPFLSDSEEEIEVMIKSAKRYGADYILYGGLTLYGNAPEDCKTVYFNFLKEHCPDLVEGYVNLFKGSTSLSKRYQKDVAIRFSELSDRYGIKNSLI